MLLVTDQNFESTVSSGFSLIMFTAPWAGPCNMARPSFEAVSARFGNQITFGEFVLDDNPTTPEKMGVKQVPVFYLLNHGVPVVVKAGAVSEEVLVGLCESVLE